MTVTITSPFDTEPDFVNELGVKWWQDRHTTEYAQAKDAHGTSLEAIGWFVELPHGARTRLLLGKNGELLAEGQALDDIGTKIDVLKFLKREKI